MMLGATTAHTHDVMGPVHASGSVKLRLLRPLLVLLATASLFGFAARAEATVLPVASCNIGQGTIGLDDGSVDSGYAYYRVYFASANTGWGLLTGWRLMPVRPQQGSIVSVDVGGYGQDVTINVAKNTTWTLYTQYAVWDNGAWNMSLGNWTPFGNYFYSRLGGGAGAGCQT